LAKKGTLFKRLKHEEFRHTEVIIEIHGLDVFQIKCFNELLEVFFPPTYRH